jgi:hypothetical protein
MRPIQPLVRLPHSHIDPNWLSTVERASGTPPREFYAWAAEHILSVTGSLPGTSRPGSASCGSAERRSPSGLQIIPESRSTQNCQADGRAVWCDAKVAEGMRGKAGSLWTGHGHGAGHAVLAALRSLWRRDAGDGQTASAVCSTGNPIASRRQWRASTPYGCFSSKKSADSIVAPLTEVAW